MTTQPAHDFSPSCHGANARGDGIANSYLKVTAPDLTLIAARRVGRFAAEEVPPVDARAAAQSLDSFDGVPVILRPPAT